MKFIHKASIFLALLIALPPFIHSIQVLDQTLIPKFLFLSVLLLVAVFSFIKDYNKSELKLLNLFDLSFLSYYLINVISITYALNKAEAYFDTQKIALTFIAYYLLRFILFKLNKLAEKRIIQVVFATSLLLVAYIFWELVDLQKTNQGAYFYLKIKGFSSHRNLLSSLLFLLLPFNIIGILQFKRKWPFILSSLTLLILLLIFQTRAIYIGLAVASIFLAFTILPKNLSKAKLKIILPTLVGIASITFLFFYLFSDTKHFFDRLNIATYLESNTAQERLFLWQQTASLIKDNPLTGVGSGNWKIFFPSYGVGDWERTAFRNVIFQRPHNDFLWVWAESGLLGFLSFASMFLLIFIAGFKSSCSKIGEKHQTKLYLILATLLGYSVISCFSFPKERIEHQVMLALLFATSVYYSRSFFEQKFQLKVKLPSNLLLLLTSIVLLSSITIGYYRFNGEKNFKSLLKANNQQKWKKMIRSAKMAYSPFYTLDFATLPIKWYEGNAYVRLNDWDTATKSFQQSLKENPYNQKVLSDLATAYGRNREYTKAEKLLQQALKINPHHEEANLNMAVIYQEKKAYKDALEYLAKVPDDSKLATRKNAITQQIQAAMNGN